MKTEQQIRDAIELDTRIIRHPRTSEEERGRRRSYIIAALEWVLGDAVTAPHDYAVRAPTGQAAPADQLDLWATR